MNSTTVNPLSITERKARVDALVKSGKVSAKSAALIDFRELTDRDREIGDKLSRRIRKR